LAWDESSSAVDVARARRSLASYRTVNRYPFVKKNNKDQLKLVVGNVPRGGVFLLAVIGILACKSRVSCIRRVLVTFLQEWGASQ
jgi:hypothetical protein